MLEEADLVKFDEYTPTDLFLHGGLTTVVEWVKEQVHDTPNSAMKPEYRDLIRSNAYAISRCISQIERYKKELTADWAKQKKEVDTVARKAIELLRKVQADTRLPLTEWEEDEKERVAIMELAIKKEADHEQAMEDNELFDLRKAKEESDRKLAEIKAEEDRKAFEIQAEIDAEAKAKAKADQEVAQAKAKIEAEAAALVKKAEDKAFALAAEQVEADRRKSADLRLANHARHRARVKREAAESLARFVARSEACNQEFAIDMELEDLIDFSTAVIEAITAGSIDFVSINF